MSNLDNLKRLPFANYDLVVYLGVGILALPFAQAYVLDPFGVQLPAASLKFASPFVAAAVETLLALFGGYALGHVIAFLSSYLIEGFIHKWLKYPSDLWLSICNAPQGRKPWHVLHQGIINTRLDLSSLLTAAFHIPLFPFYAVLHATGSFGFYLPKLGGDFRRGIVSRIAEVGLPTNVSHGSPWIKVLEHYVANNCPAGYIRMYNYLVIFGLLRSLAFVCLAYTWIRFLRIFLAGRFDEHGHLVGLAARFDPAPTNITSYAVAALFSTFTVMAFAKFNRRYFEEAVYAFVLSGRSVASAGDPRAPLILDASASAQSAAQTAR